VAIESEQAWDVTLVPSLHGLVADRTPEYAIWLFHEVLSMELCDVFSAIPEAEKFD